MRHHTLCQSILASFVISTIASSAALCDDYVLIDSRGSDQPQGPDKALGPITDQILALLPRGSRHDTVYPALYDATQLSTFTGSKDVTSFIQTRLRECPKQKFALLGYSQGATVTSHVLKTFPPSSPEGKHILAVVLIGNPYYVTHEQSNVDESCRPRTGNPNGILRILADYRLPGAWYRSGRVLDICFTNDPICNGLNVKDALFLLDPNFGPHSSYSTSQSVQKCATDFIISHLG